MYLYNSGTEYTMINLFEKAEMLNKECSRQQWHRMEEDRIYDGGYTVRDEPRKLKKTITYKATSYFSTPRRCTISTTGIPYK